MKINSVDPASTKPPERSGKTIGNNSQDKESAENFRPSPSQQKAKAAISPIPAEEEKKKKVPAAYMPKPPYPQSSLSHHEEIKHRQANDDKRALVGRQPNQKEEAEGIINIINRGKQSNHIHALRQDHHV
ncbi:hypothetical protein PIB30_084809 [Stylosanthes scabra]|uniref:Uncharacterized protein n=1 Tax=Stylosanthes scabra TaxID=79078 RepID=A0ABU6YRK0_9FABA|nr:hypothetical protein [Stylosanthes scabra]